jgi:hypothetical protein
MSTTTETPIAAAKASAPSFAQSATFRTFATVFAIATPIIYVICEMRNWPLFTYHPGTNRLDLGFAPAVRDQGPAMYWYGWTVTMLIGGAVLGFIATKLPESVVRKIPLSLVWIVPLAMVPVLIYALRFFWRWE